METKGKGRREQQQQHKKLLAAMLSQDSFDSALHSSVSSVAEEEMEDEDDAMELLGKLPSTRHTRPWPVSDLWSVKMWQRPANLSWSFIWAQIRMFQSPSGPAFWQRQEIYVFLSEGWTGFALC